MSVTFNEKALVFNELTLQMLWPILDAVEQEGKVFVLLNPDSYLLDKNYKHVRHGGAVIKNLMAFDKTGSKLWEAEMPQDADYYYRICSKSPLIANSFSSYRCQIDPNTGAILSREFYK